MKSFFSLSLLGLLAVSARAEEIALDQPSAPVSHAALHFGGFLVSDVNADFSMSGPAGSGTKIDFVNSLGGESSTEVFRADGAWQFNGRHRLEASWFDIDLHGHSTITANITFGNRTFVANTEITSRFHTEIYKLVYGYTFYKGPRHEFTGVIGAHIIDFHSNLTAPRLGTGESFTMTAPLPVFGIEWKSQWTKRLSTRASLQYFTISLDENDVSGDLTDALFVAEYAFGRNWGIGGGYDRFDMECEFHRGQLTFDIEHSYDGLLSYIFVRF
jgi:hypothetical protein